MEVLGLAAWILSVLLSIYVFVLLVRLIFEYIPMFNRSWRPEGAVLVIAEVTYTLTDPPIRLLRRFIPPLRLGVVAIDFAFPLTMLVCFVLIGILRSIAAAV